MTVALRGEAAERTTANANTHSATLHLQSTPTVRLSLAVKRLLIDTFTADDLRQLAALKDAQSPGMVARRNLSDASIEELAEMLTNARTPTIGWWSRAS
jgi:hypothetical protein